MRLRVQRLLLHFAITALALSPFLRASAGGLLLLDRGARPLARGGAFVAGADDPHALWYNPAGLGRSGNQLVADFTLTFLLASYQRLNTDGEFAPKVEASATPLPIPTLAFSHRLGLKDVTFGAGLFTPNMLLLNWPRSVPLMNGTRGSGPTRYSLLGLKGSVLSNVALGLAYHGVKGLSIGADVQVALGRFKASTALSAADGVVCAFPEDPSCDAYAQVDVLPAWGVSAVFGATYSPSDMLILGASVMLPYTLEGPATLNLTTPTSALFRDAYFTGKKANFSMNFPLIVRVGGELRFGKVLRMESAFVWEQWSRQRTLDVVPTEPIFLRDVVGVTDYQIGTLRIPRGMQDAWSVRGGFELFVPDGPALGLLSKLKIVLRWGLAYERSAFARRRTTPLTLDSDKIVLSGGMSLRVHERVRLEGTLGYVFMTDLKVRSSSIRQPTALRPRSVDATPLGNGNYDMDALFIGAALNVLLD